MTHAAQITLALFAYVGGEKNRDGGLDVGVAKRGGEGQESGEAGAVVADSGSVDAGAIGIFAGFARGSSSEDCIEMGREEQVGSIRGFGFSGRGSQFSESVPFVVQMQIGEAEVFEAVEKPGGPGLLVERWGGDADEFKLPLTELRLVEVQPMEGAMDGGKAGQAGNAALGGRGWHQ
jgi:hypothetical protein